MIFEILDYKGNRHPVDLGDLDDIAVIDIKVVTGDETLDIVYKDYSKIYADAETGRWRDIVDDIYEIYHFQKEKNLIDDPDFLNRKSSYDHLYEDVEE